MNSKEYCELCDRRDFLNHEQDIMYSKYLYIGNPYSKEDCSNRRKYVEECEKEIQEITRKLGAIEMSNCLQERIVWGILSQKEICEVLDSDWGKKWLISPILFKEESK